MKKISLNNREAPQRKGDTEESLLGPHSKISETEKRLAGYLLEGNLRSHLKRIPDNIREELFSMLPLRSKVYLVCQGNCSEIWLCRMRPFFTRGEAKKHVARGDCISSKSLNLFGIIMAIREVERGGDIAPSERKVIEKLKKMIDYRFFVR
ncbi:MAG: hypothetical protein WC514_00845 [Candidatus Paceibacterota bacterium]